VALRDLESATPTFDRKSEDGTWFRIYRHNHFEVRTTKEPNGQEEIGVIFSVGSSVQVSLRRGSRQPKVQEHDTIVKATEYVRNAGGDADCQGRPSFGSFVVLQTEQGASVMTEKLRDGTVTWEENADDLEDRSSNAKVVRTTGCAKAFVCVKDMKAFRNNESSSSSASQSRCKLYAQGAFTLATTGSSQQACSGFWQRSEGSWQLLQAGRWSKQGRWEDGCWQADWEGGWESSWQDGWESTWEDWQCEWDQGWHFGLHGGRQATMVAARPQAAGPKLGQASKMRRHFELQATLGLSDQQMTRRNCGGKAS